MKHVLVCIFILFLGILHVQAEPSRKDIEFVNKANIAVARIYQSGKYAKALDLAQKVVAHAERVLGNEHPSTLTSVNNLALLYHRQGRYALAEPLYKRALEASERVQGKEHPETLTRVNNLAALYRAQGRYALAEPLYKRALEASERMLGKEHPNTFRIVNNLAFLYQAQGRYTLAEPLYKLALEARERMLGKEHPSTLTSVNNLAELYRVQGRYELAEPLYKRALEQRESVLGKEHPDTLLSVNNLALLYQAQGRYALAKPLYKRALEASERVLGKEHPDALLSVNNLAGLYDTQGRYELAEPLYKRALEQRESVLGKEHPDTLLSVNNLALLYRSQGRYALAEPLYKRALEASERVLGKEHPDTLLSVNNLAFLYYDQQKWTLAETLFDHGTSGYANRTGLVGADSLAGQKKTEAQRKTIDFQIYLKTAYRVSTDRPQRTNPLGSKTFSRLQWIQGTGASAALSQMAVRVGAGNDRLAELVRERQDLVQGWKGFDALLSKALGLPPKKRNADVEKKLREQLQATEKRIGEIDATFSKDFPEYAELANSRPLSIAQVQGQLRNDEALVYIVDTPKWKKTEEETFIWVVTKTQMKWVRSKLGTKALTDMVKTLRCGLDHASWGKARTAKLCNQLLDTNLKYADLKSNNSLPFKKDIAYQLYDGLFGQVKELIKGKNLLLVPSGPLTSLPFQVLLTEKPSAFVSYSSLKWLIDEHDLTVLPSVASLKALRRTSKRSSASDPFFGIGNPLLTGPSGKDRSAWKKQSCDFSRKRTLQVAGWQLPSKITSFFRGGRVDLTLLKRQYPLPETADELCAVADVLGAKAQSVKLGAKATETNIKKLSTEGALKNAKVIHFATHGLLSGETQSLLKYKAEPSLMLTPPDTATQEDDGLLTASEITQLKLDADWVILSACNTAAGDKPGAEPMSGLAKAFFYAGARALLVSHWAVDSNATVDLITTSLKAQTANPELGRAGALRVAMRKMIKSRRSHPAYWAPFVVVGEGSYISR